MKIKNLLLIFFVAVTMSFTAEKPIHVFTIGDSTMSDKKPSVYPEGKKDNTHLCDEGAQQVANMVSSELKKSSLELSENAIDKNIIVGLDHWFNREISKKTGEPYHYLWTDTLNSGFSQLGEIFINEGAVLKTISEVPTIDVLRELDVYIIVDPDTPKESENPNYISEMAIHNIGKWVKEGGTLLLMANDGPNCEFMHFNKLAEVFGFQFIPITLNPVLNKDWEMGAEIDLPDHPLFIDVEKIYMKEVAPIKIDSNVQSVLNDGEHVFIAESFYGKGRVLAIGDPWLYNEYIDHGRLPESFQNLKAANNLVKYLIDN
ncbi:MAG: hypothetical protein KAS71_19355 [Bacteroidales bacterium]|nr:hypothetical protein [Bacteroidales bacterium]